MLSFFKKTGYKWLSPVLRQIYDHKITSKYIQGSDRKLYYEKGQHLGFLLNPRIVYEPEFRDLVLSLIHQNDLVFEIGSNIGQYSLIISEKIGKDGKLICIEPDTNNFAFLSFNSIINRCSNIELLQMAVADREGTTHFYKDTVTGGRMGSLFQKYVGKQFEGVSEEIKTSTLRKLTEQYGVPDFVKVDVEGAESLIFSDMEVIHDKTTFLIEVRSETKNDIFQKFTAIGFSVYVLGTEMKKTGNDAEVPDFANLIIRKD